MASFPKQERDPFCGLIGHPSTLDFRACFDGDVLVGLYAILTVGDLSHVQFLAVEERLRNDGYGSQILDEIKSRYASNRIIVDIEEPDETSPNHHQRQKRLHFYTINGFTDDGIRYTWHGMDYRILIYNGTLSHDEFFRFWETYEDAPGSITDR